jgi:hypothetical protein
VIRYFLEKPSVGAQKILQRLETILEEANPVNPADEGK